MKIEHPKDMPQLKQLIISEMWKDVKNTPVEREWRKYKQEFQFEGKAYVMECEFKIRSIREKLHLTYRNMFIEYKQIILDLSDEANRGLIQ